jgi:hypothetical protein
LLAKSKNPFPTGCLILILILIVGMSFIYYIML